LPAEGDHAGCGPVAPSYHGFYYEQWSKLLDRAQDLRDFLEENKSKLKLKE
jgi:hypothetical protein